MNRSKMGRISLDMDTYQVFVGEKKIGVTITEFNLLDCLFKNVGKTLSRDDLFEQLWDQSYPRYASCPGIPPTVRTVDTHIHRLRSKLGEAAYLIKTVRGIGYRFDLERNGGAQ